MAGYQLLIRSGDPGIDQRGLTLTCTQTDTSDKMLPFRTHSGRCVEFLKVLDMVFVKTSSKKLFCFSMKLIIKSIFLILP